MHDGDEKSLGGKWRRKKLWFISGSLVLVFAGMIGWFYERMVPSHHFRDDALPVLAKPAYPSPSASKTTTTTMPSAQPFARSCNIALFGVDSRSPNEASRTDSIMIVHASFSTNQYDIISIPRDTRVYLPGYGETKITHANFLEELNGGSFSQGAQSAIQALSNLTGLTINYYVETDYWGLKDMVDILGGIHVSVPFNVKLTHAWYPGDNGKVISKGDQSLDGEMVTELVHERYSLNNGDFGRQQLQEEALIGIVNSLKKPENFTHLPELLHSLNEYVVATNLSSQDMLSIALGGREFSKDKLNYYQVPGTSAYLMDPILGEQVYYWIPNHNELQQTISAHFEN